MDDYNNYKYRLRIDSTGKEIGDIVPERPAFPPDRLHRYNAVRHQDLPVHETKDGDDTPDMSFLLLENSQLISPAEASPKSPAIDALSANARLFEILSARSDIDHPVCRECTEVLLAAYKVRLDQATQERDTYLDFVGSIQDQASTKAEAIEAEKSLAESKRLQNEAFDELLRLEAEKRQLDDEIEGLEMEALELEADERTYWLAQNSLNEDIAEFEHEQAATAAKYKHEMEVLERLRRTNVYTDALHIASQGSFATINGLRLGRLPPKHAVDWPEINAAWGYAALLLVFVSEQINCSLQGYRVRPLGSTSKIEMEPANGQSLDLYSSGDLPLGISTLLHRRINAGMVAFLECLRQLCEHSQHKLSGNVPTKPPYRIQGDKIGSEKSGFRSIRLGAGSDKDWTDACRCTLTCCKYLLVAVNHHSSD